MRGYACIALDNPKCGHNVGGAMRAVGVYGASLLVLAGPRVEKLIRHPSDTMNVYKHVPTVVREDVFDALPYGCVPVAVDLLPNAKPLPTFTHPERAFYVFGAEDATLDKRITDRCEHVIYVPSRSGHCMNLAACVNVILYDRMAKQKQSTPNTFSGEIR